MVSSVSLNDYISLASFVIGAIGTFVGILGFLRAVQEAKERKRLDYIIRSSLWSHYQRTNNALGSVQKSLEQYKRIYSQNIDPELLQSLSQSDAFTQEVFLNTIRQIQLFEPSFLERDFQRWKNEGKLTDDKIVVFRQYCVTDGSNIISSSITDKVGSST